MVLLIGLVIGLLLGLTGAGGSVVGVPLMVYVLGLPQPAAAAMSLAAVGLAALFGLALRRGKALVVWQPGLVVAVAGAAAAPAGQWLAQRLPQPAVMTMFAVLILLVAVRMWRQASNSPEESRIVRGQAGPLGQTATACNFSESGQFEMRLPCLLRVVLAGLGTGLLSGLFGVGGGFVVVPALMLLVGLSISEAVATSLLVIVVVAASGFVSAAMLMPLSWPLLAWLSAGSLAGMLAGSALSRYLAGPGLQRLFVLVLAGVALITLWRELAGYMH